MSTDYMNRTDLLMQQLKKDHPDTFRNVTKKKAKKKKNTSKKNSK